MSSKEVRLVDDNGFPTVAGVYAHMAGIDISRVNKLYRVDRACYSDNPKPVKEAIDDGSISTGVSLINDELIEFQTEELNMRLVALHQAHNDLHQLCHEMLNRTKHPFARKEKEVWEKFTHDCNMALSHVRNARDWHDQVWGKDKEKDK